MSRLALLLHDEERKIRKIIDRLEQLSGFNSVDVRILAENNAAVKQKVAALGLDSDDTAAPELYYHLKSKLEADLTRAASAWNLKTVDDVAVMLNRVARPDECLSIKCTTMRALLKSSPPRKTMKLLGYRSLDSMLKREDIRPLLAACLKTESLKWSSQLAHKVSRLKAKDFEFRSISYIAAPQNYKAVSSSINPVVIAPLMSAVILWPDQKTASMLAGDVLLGLKAADLIGKESDLLSAKQFSGNFAKTAEQLFVDFTAGHITVNGQTVLPVGDYLNLEADKPVHIFSGLHPALNWWKNTAHLAFEAERAVSMNIHDVYANLVGQLDYSEQCAQNFSHALLEQLVRQYSAHGAVKNYLDAQIDDTFISLENIRTKEFAPEFEEVNI